MVHRSAFIDNKWPKCMVVVVVAEVVDTPEAVVLEDTKAVAVVVEVAEWLSPNIPKEGEVAEVEEWSDIKSAEEAVAVVDNVTCHH